jgi:hypothetical protein
MMGLVVVVSNTEKLLSPAQISSWGSKELLDLVLCRWGYQNISVLEAVVNNYTAAGVPLECLWVDIEHQASRFQTMTFDPGQHLALPAPSTAPDEQP